MLLELSLDFCRGYILRSLQISKLINTARVGTSTHKDREDTVSIFCQYLDNKDM